MLPHLLLGVFGGAIHSPMIESSAKLIQSGEVFFKTCSGFIRQGLFVEQMNTKVALFEFCTCAAALACYYDAMYFDGLSHLCCFC